MCTSFIVNKGKTIVGFNLDILDMEWRIEVSDEHFHICINDIKEGWMPLFGVNNLGNAVMMPTCWPACVKSDPYGKDEINIINLDIDLLLKKISFEEAKIISEKTRICSVPRVTFQAQLTNKSGDVLLITPGLGREFRQKPDYSIMSNFSPFQRDDKEHPWMGKDRYELAKKLIASKDQFDVQDGFEVLKACSQKVCPTVVSFVYNANENKVYWSENQDYQNIYSQEFIHA